MSAARKRALVTGAASGMGRAFSLSLAHRGYELVLADVDHAGLVETAKRCCGDARIAVVDLASDDAMPKLAAQAEALELVVCCAGVLGAGAFAEQGFDVFRRTIEINLVGTARTIHATLPALRRARGQIVVLASTASLHGWPLLAAYSASKGAVENLCDALRVELAADGIGVTTVFPLLVDTPMLGEERALPPILRGGRVRAEDVVRRALRGATRRRRRVYVPWLARLVAVLHGLWPRLLDRWGSLRGLPDRSRSFDRDRGDYGETVGESTGS
jgi:short-subunit dehydrogenase